MYFLPTDYSELTNIIGGTNDLPDVLILLNDPSDFQIAQLDLTVRELTHEHDVLWLEKKI